MDVVRFSKIHEDAYMPTRGSSGAAGFDLYSVEDVRIPAAGGKAVIHTGIVFEIPEGYYGRIAPRSGLAVKNSIDVLAGVCDQDYRGEICVILINHDPSKYLDIFKGFRIAQIIFEKIGIPSALEEVPFEVLTTTERGEGGFGSTGLICAKESQ